MVKFLGIKIEKRDLWVGAYLGPEKYPVDGGRSRKLCVCPVPCVVLTWRATW